MGLKNLLLIPVFTVLIMLVAFGNLLVSPALSAERLQARVANPLSVTSAMVDNGCQDDTATAGNGDVAQCNEYSLLVGISGDDTSVNAKGNTSSVTQFSRESTPLGPDRPAAFPAWETVMQLTNDTSAPYGAAEPRVAASPNGSEVTIGYIGGDFDTILVNPYYVESSNNGITWSSPLTIHLSSGPVLKSLNLDVTYSSDNKRHAVWREGDDLVYKHGDNWGQSGGLVFVSQPSPSTSFTGASDPSIVATGSSTLDVIWSEDVIPTNPNIYYARSINSGSSWSTPSPVATTAPSSFYPSLTVDQSGKLHAVWEEGVFFGTTIFYSQGTPGAGTAVSWSTPISITLVGNDEARKPEITTAGSTLHVSYSRLHLRDNQQETAQHVTCTSQCTDPNNWHSVATSGQVVGVNVNYPNDTIVSDIVYAGGCTYTYYDGTSSSYPGGKNIIWGESSCDVGTDEVTDHTIQSNNPSLAAQGSWVHLTYEQYTSQIDPQYAHIYYVRGSVGPVGYTIQGQITDGNSNPLAGVLVSTSYGQSTFTDGTGTYSFTGLMPDTYAITPTLAGYVFSPTHYPAVTVPPDKFNVNFIGGAVPAPFLDLPFDYPGRGTVHPYSVSVFQSRFQARINSVFDHRKPLDRNDDYVVPYVGFPELYNPLPGWPGSIDCGMSGVGNLDCYDGHEGYDFQRTGGVGEPVYPAAPGTVAAVGWGVRSVCYGYGVEIDHGNGFSTLYGHLRGTPPVVSSQAVTIGTKIGVMGNTTGCGTSTGNHLHFGLYFNGTLLDPSGWLDNRSDPWSGQPQHLWLHSPPDSSQWTVSGQTGSSISSGAVAISVPQGAFSGVMTFTLTHVPVSRPYAQSIPVGHSFSFHNQVPAAALGQTPPSLSATPPIFLTQPFTITVHYNDTEIIGMEENTLGLYHWDDLAEDWQPLATTLDLPGNQAIANSSELGLFALFAADPDQAGPGIGEPIYYYNTVLNNQELFVAVPISDTLSGDHGVQAATLNYGYTSPFTEMALMGSSLSNTGDGHWLFTIPPQTQVTERATLKFWIEAKDGDLTPEASVNNNMGAYYSVTIVAPPIAGFTATPIEGNAPLVVAFTNTSTGAYDSSLWHFGDGNTSTLSDPTHIYEKPGMYTVTLTVSGQAGDDTTRVYLPNCEFVTLLQADLAQNSAQNAGIARKLVTQRPICHATADF